MTAVLAEGGARLAGAGAIGSPVDSPGDLPGSPDTSLITVITPVMNGARHIRECIDSIIAQTHPAVEHVIVDGGSTDGTLDILREYGDRIAYWRSAPDRGIYDAMNRGIELARGAVIGIAGSDDALYPTALAAVADALAAAPDTAFAYGAVDLVRDDGQAFGRTEPVDAARFAARPFDDMPFPHLAMFIRAAAYRRVGGYDQRFRVRADYDLTLRLHRQGLTGVPVEGVVGRYRVGGTSDALGTCLETRRLLRHHGAPRLQTEIRFLSSLAAVSAVAILPHGVVRRLKRMRPSRHRFH